MVPNDAGWVEVGGTTVAVGGIAVAIGGVAEGDIGIEVGEGVDKTPHAKIKKRAIEMKMNFFCMAVCGLPFN